MKTKTIWIWAFLFGILASGALYATLSKKNTQLSSNTDTQSDADKKAADNSKKNPGNGQTTGLKDGGLANLSLAQGKRAMSIAVNEVQGVSGFITPGAYVDVVVMVPPPQGENASAQILLQNVKVLAVGQLNATPENGSKGSLYRTVTLEVLPSEGSALAFAAQKGAVSLMLRPPGDTAGTPPSHITLEQLNKGVIPR
ncbi:Flp pilus assembly protein CpaB [Effusibacillus consociatus]|uniref:Flp pilus assembly protein CpaB n=1 Tax=Effusibacillus consociatus TaxID=1117041 RepID=A0ABV9Q2E0_9BACL